VYIFLFLFWLGLTKISLIKIVSVVVTNKNWVFY